MEKPLTVASSTTSMLMINYRPQGVFKDYIKHTLGFDLMGIEGEYSSLVAFEDDIIVNVVVMLLILIGGIGFIV
ncbi:MAG: hypothetical protein IJN86_01065, partial [Clostridia bacterium]|nr:hypothetical protein [Clostridia bacterium]